MQVTSHRPRVSRIITFDDAETPFHSIRVEDAIGGELSMFISEDWSEWDAIVAKVAEYRAGQSGGDQ